MSLCRILVMAVLNQGLGCDFDRLQELFNKHWTVRNPRAPVDLGGGGLETNHKGKWLAPAKRTQMLKNRVA